MRHLIRRAALLALIPSVLVAGQTTQIAGTWTGYIGKSEATPSSVTVAIKMGADGNLTGTVTGPQIDPGVIKSGTFDPKTGNFNFAVQLRDKMNGEGGEVKFAGMVLRDTAQGKMVLGDQHGVFKLVRGASHVGAPEPKKLSEGAAEARRGFVEVSDWIVRAAEMVPAEKYSYRPVATVRSFGQLVAHVVDGSRYYCARASGRNLEWSDITEKGVTQKAVLVAALRQSVNDCLAVHDQPGNVGQLMSNVAHNNLHYGNMVTYIRMLGLVPPSN